MALAPSSAVESSRLYAKLNAHETWNPQRHENYKSYYVNNGAHAEEEVARIKERNFVTIIKDWTDVLLKWPRATASKVALIVKERIDKTLKLRFVVDLRRSGVNGEAEIPERVVLPRILDFANSIIDLLETKKVNDDIELFVLDFADAFYTIWLREKDRGSLVFKVTGGWAVFNRFCFGMAGAPLVWGRVAASACRIGQACFTPRELRLQCYVDDPAVAVAGSRKERNRLVGMLLLLWSALGAGLSWGKGARGTQVPWIGASFQLGARTHTGGGSTLFPGVAVSNL